MGNEKKQTNEKPLEKMTATELRDIAKELPDITGAHGMNKSELISAIKAAKGIEETSSKKRPDATVRQIKAKILEMKKITGGLDMGAESTDGCGCRCPCPDRIDQNMGMQASAFWSHFNW